VPSARVSQSEGAVGPGLPGELRGTVDEIAEELARGHQRVREVALKAGIAAEDEDVGPTVLGKRQDGQVIGDAILVALLGELHPLDQRPAAGHGRRHQGGQPGVGEVLDCGNHVGGGGVGAEQPAARIDHHGRPRKFGD
jgi:hypothetical protein